MRIGVNIDDTICQTTEAVEECLDKYSEELGGNPLDIMNDEVLREEFLNKYQDEIYTNTEIKPNAAEVLKRLRSKGNEIYVITSRKTSTHENAQSIFEITEEWLKKHDIEVDAIISSTYGETRADVCKKYDIDLMIEDDPFNYKKIISIGKKCVLFDDKEKYALKEDYVSNWIELEKYIERNR